MRVEITYVGTEYRVAFYTVNNYVRSHYYSTLGEAMARVQDWLRTE